MAGPLVIQNLVHVVNVIVDTFWLGRLGEDEVAAIGLNFPIISIVAAGISLVAIGTQITLAQRVGAEEFDQARRLAFTGLVTAIIVGTVIAAVVAFGANAVMGLLTSDAAVSQLAAIYLWTVMIFYPFAYASDTLENAFIGWGDTSAAMYINLVMVGTNIVLDPLLIFGWGPFPAMGIQGAALASGLGFATGCSVALLFSLGIRSTFTFHRGTLQYDFGFVREIVDVGVPVSGQRLARDIVRVFILVLVSLAGGAAGLAAYTVGTRVATLAVVPALGLQQAAQAIIGQNLGANRPDRARRTTTVGAIMAAGGLIAIGALQWAFAGPIVELLVPDLTVTGHEMSVLFLRILAFSYWAMGGTYLILAGFNGARRTRTSFVVDLLKYWGIRFPIAVVAIPSSTTVGIAGIVVTPGLDLGIEAIFWAVTISNVVAVIGGTLYFGYTTRRGMFERAAQHAATAVGGD